MDRQLKSCPICGGESILTKYIITKSGREVLGWHVECRECGFGENSGRGNLFPEKAIDSWNTES